MRRHNKTASRPLFPYTTLWDNRPVLMAAEQTLYHWLGEHYPRINARHSLEGLRKLNRILLQRNP